MPSYELHVLKVANGFFSNYIYMIVDRKTRYAAIIDPAWEWEKITSWIIDKRAKIQAVLLTHTHYDHIHLVESVIQAFDAQVYVSRQEVEAYQFSSQNLQLLEAWDHIRIGDTKIEVLLTPGHTAGSVCFLLQDALISGDTLFAEGCGMCNFPGGDAEQMFNSLQMLKRLVPPYVRVYPGHSYGEEPGQFFEAVMERNIYLQLDKKEHFISFRMRKNQVFRNPQ